MDDATAPLAQAAGLASTEARFPNDMREALATPAKQTAALPRTSDPRLKPTPSHVAPRSGVRRKNGRWPKRAACPRQSSFRPSGSWPITRLGPRRWSHASTPSSAGRCPRQEPRHGKPPVRTSCGATRCPASAPLRQNGAVEERRISGSS